MQFTLNKASAFVLALSMVCGLANAADFKAGEVIVKYKDGIVRTRTEMNSMYNKLGVKRVKHFSGIMKGFEQLFFDESVKVQDMVADLQKNSSVEYAEPNFIMHTFPVLTANNPAAHAASGTPCTFPGIPFPPGCTDGGTNPNPPNPNPPSQTRPKLENAPAEVNPPVADPELGKLYGLTKINASGAWAIHKGSKEFIVADIDTGIDYNHEDLSFNVWRNPAPTKEDIVGFDFIHNDGLPFDDNEHGTHTAGTIGAVGGNGKGVSGVNQRVSLMALKFLTGEGSGTLADGVRAIDYAVEHGAKVINASWGGSGAGEEIKSLKEAIDRAGAKGVLFVAAAGNDGVNNDTASNKSYPASFDSDNLIAVAATDKDDKMAFFSNFGAKTTHVGAPGVDIYSTIPGNKYKAESGTSMACPHVVGAAALIWSKHPEWDYKKVKAVLMKTADRVSSLEGKTISGGRINVMNALQATD